MDNKHFTQVTRSQFVAKLPAHRERDDVGSYGARFITAPLRFSIARRRRAATLAIALGRAAGFPITAVEPGSMRRIRHAFIEIILPIYSKPFQSGTVAQLCQRQGRAGGARICYDR